MARRGQEAILEGREGLGSPSGKTGGVGKPFQKSGMGREGSGAPPEGPGGLGAPLGRL